MKKVVVSAMVLVILFAVATFSSASAAIAPGIYVDHTNAQGGTIIDIDGHPKIVFDGYHFDYSDLGAGDVIRILLPVVTPMGATVYLPIGIFTDIPDRISLFQKLYAGFNTSIQLVDSSDIEAKREGKSKTMMVVWKTALEIPAERWPGGLVPAMTIPPGRLIFRGHGDAVSISSNSSGPGWSQSVTSTGYYGNATFVCPTWDFGGPVGVNEGNYRTIVRTEGTITTTILNPMKL